MLRSLLACVRVRPDRNERPCGDRPQPKHTALTTVALDSYRDWQIEVGRTRPGLVKRPDQFSALLQPPGIGGQECLAGFDTQQAALAAARKRIDSHLISTTLRWHEPHTPLRKPRTSGQFSRND